MSSQAYIPVDLNLKPIAYAWPGGYPVFYWDDENNILCPDCAGKSDMSSAVVAYDINWEDEMLYCDDCGLKIESAYGEDELEEEKKPCVQCQQPTSMEDTNGLCIDCWVMRDEE